MEDVEATVPISIHISLLRSHMTTWQNTYVDAKYAAQIATSVGNKQLVEQSTTRMKQALQAIAWIEAKITELEGGDADVQV
jgi:uncharacterized protein involved in exopolysaccharide biosynthesis